jgi:lipopolysaccharide transport system permease protein
MASAIWERRELLLNLAKRNLKIRYKNSFFGFFWTLLNPLFMILVYMAFIGIMRFPMDLAYLIMGVIPWHFMTMCIGDCTNVIEGNANLIKKTAFPRLILPLSTLFANAVNFFFSLLVVLALIPFIKLVSTGAAAYHFNLWYLPLAVAAHFCLVAGLCLIVSVSNVYFRDTEHIISVALMAWFFMSPVIYSLEYVAQFKPHAPFQALLLKLFYLNPMVLILSLYRKAFLDTQLPWNIFVVISLFIVVLIFAAGLVFFRRQEPYFADEM